MGLRAYSSDDWDSSWATQTALGLGGSCPYRWVPQAPKAQTPEGLVPANLSSGHRTALERRIRGVLVRPCPRSALTHTPPQPWPGLASTGSSETAAARGGRAGLGWQLAGPSRRESHSRGASPTQEQVRLAQLLPASPWPPPSAEPVSLGARGLWVPPPWIREGPGSEMARERVPHAGHWRNASGSRESGRPQSSAQA